jgi:uncharacterized membrane protein YedE/YeeE
MDVLTRQCPWYLAGPLLALLVVGLRWTGNLHLGALGSFVATESWIERPRGLPSWRVFFFVGTIAGGLIYALATHTFQPTFSNGAFDRLGLVAGAGLAARGMLLLGAGALIGFGARTAGGCTSGHGICGVAQRSPASIAATATFVLVAVVVAHLLPIAPLGGAP